MPEESRALRARRLYTQPPIASTPGSSPPERPGPDNMTGQPWFDATCPCNTASSTLSCLFQQKERDKAEVNRGASRGGTGTRCVRPWSTSTVVLIQSFRRGSKRSEVAYIIGAPSTPDYLLALLRELSHVPQGLAEMAEANQVRKTNQSVILYQFKKRVGKSILTFRTQNLFDFFFEGFRSTLQVFARLWKQKQTNKQIGSNLPGIRLREKWISGSIFVFGHLAVSQETYGASRCLKLVLPEHFGLPQPGGQPPAPMNHVKIFKGWPPRDASSKLVQLWYKTFPTDQRGQVETKKRRILSNKTSIA